MTEAVALLAERLVARGVAPALPQLTFATLVDNALEHGGGAVSPVAAVYLAGTFVTVSSRDGGQSVAGCGRPVDELRRRIQIPAEDVDPGPGAPAGIPWLSQLLRTRCPGGRLEFRAGNGYLSFRDGVWVCRVARQPVTGFVAIARIVLNS